MGVTRKEAADCGFKVCRADEDGLTDSAPTAGSAAGPWVSAVGHGRCGALPVEMQFILATPDQWQVMAQNPVNDPASPWISSLTTLGLIHAFRLIV